MPGDSLAIAVSGGNSYTWLNGQSFLTDASIPNPSVFPDTTFVFEVAVANDCGADTLSFEVFGV
ncbi:MAG: hypothetical protein R2795_05265 [Saprospiraceae bacterium]